MKASEVFDLPVVVGEKAYDSDDIFQANGNGLWCATFCSDEQAKIAARAINHADALADALDNVIETLELYGAHDCPYYRIAIDELKKYRGCSDE